MKCPLRHFFFRSHLNVVIQRASQAVCQSSNQPSSKENQNFLLWHAHSMEERIDQFRNTRKTIKDWLKSMQIDGKNYVHLQLHTWDSGCGWVWGYESKEYLPFIIWDRQIEFCESLKRKHFSYLPVWGQIWFLNYLHVPKDSANMW